MTARRLIVNADDFGLSRSVNRGILETHERGVVTSCTLLANGPAFEDGLKLLRETPGLGVGIHLNPLRGRPVSPAESLPRLTRNGSFHLKLTGLIRLPFRLIAEELEREYRAQIEKVLDHGLRPTHLDGENRRLKQMYADLSIDNALMKELIEKKL